MGYSTGERAFFVALAIGCGMGLNGIFLWASLVHPDWMSAAMQSFCCGAAGPRIFPGRVDRAGAARPRARARRDPD